MNARKILDEAKKVREEAERARNEGVEEVAKKRLFEPFVQMDYRQNSGEQTNGKNIFGFSKTEINEKDEKLLLYEIKRLEEKLGIEDPLSDRSNWYAADKVYYSIDNTEFNILEMLPDGFKILFCPNSKINTGAIYREERTIFVIGDIASLGSLSIILHEVGHMKDAEELKKMGKDEFVEGGDYHENEEAEKLRKEREASLFAIRRMWPILRSNPQTKSDVLLFLKNIAYNSYCENAFSNLATGSAMAHFARDFEDNFDYEEQERWDAWWKFKNSAEYSKWKKIDKFASLGEDEEYGAWCEWMENENKI